MSKIIIPTLMYHFILPASKDYLTIGADLFYKQIHYLSQRYNIIGIEDIAKAVKTNRALPSKPIVISFDDSLRNNFEYAIPVLKKCKTTAIFFVIAEYIGQNNLWDRKAYSIAEHLSKNDMKEIIRLGFEIGSHSLTHQRLSKLLFYLSWNCTKRVLHLSYII